MPAVLVTVSTVTQNLLHPLSASSIIDSRFLDFMVLGKITEADAPAIHLERTRPVTHTRLTALFRDYPGGPVPEGKTNLDFTEARDSEWQWHQLGHMQACTSLQTDNHASTPPLSFYRPDALPAAQPTASKH